MGALSPNTMLGIGTGVSGLAGLGGSISQASAAQTQADYQAQQYKTNERLAGMQADDAITRGNDAAYQTGRQGKQAVGKQVAALAASGVDTQDGSAYDVTNESQRQIQQEVLRTKNNAWREAWGYKVQANQAGGDAAFAKMAGGNVARNTILTGGMNFVGDAMKTGYQFSGKGRL